MVVGAGRYMPLREYPKSDTYRTVRWHCACHCEASMIEGTRPTGLGGSRRTPPWCGEEAVDGVEVDGSRGLRRDAGRGERGGALQDALGDGEGRRRDLSVGCAHQPPSRRVLPLSAWLFGLARSRCGCAVRLR